ncbi:MAG: efflux RND transporter permease subunit [Halobacteriovoraceae bacterium]|nr:efflux RND transporter permease subunit [Halobacteriovoraceae bacterium]
MRNFLNYFIEKPAIVNMLTVMIFIVGLWSLLELNREMFPKVEFDVITITTDYPRSSAEDVEKLITITIERKIKGVNGIKKINAMSLEGRSIIYITVDPDNDIEEVKEDLVNEINSIDDFPNDTEPPVIKTKDNTNRPILDISISRVEYGLLRNAAIDLRDELERLKQIRKVDFGGYQVDEIKVEIDPKKLNFFELTMGEVARSIKDRNLNLTAGKIESKKGDIVIRTLSEFKNIKDIEDVVIRSNDSGKRVKVKDIAKVRRMVADSDVLQRSQGERAIFLNIKIKAGSDKIDISNLVKNKTTEYLKQKKYEKIKVRFADDLSYYVKRRLGVLKSSAFIGMILVISCLFFFLNWRISIVTSMGAPLAFLISFIVMDFFGITFNLISMFGLILVLGMLVDDAIIVAEYYYQRLEQGLDRKKAALEAAVKTIKPVTATILTTMVAFGSLFFMGGIMGKFTRHIPTMVIICLAASLLECFLILPSHLCEFVKIKKNKKEKKWFTKMQIHYSNWLNKFLFRPWHVLLAFLGLFILSILLSLSMRFELFPGDDVRKIFVQIKGPVGASRDRTDQEIMKLEKLAMKMFSKDELKQVKARVGELTGQHANKTGGHYGSLIMYLTSPSERNRSTDEIITTMIDSAKKIVDTSYILSVSKAKGGPPRGKSFEIEILGDKLEDLKTASKQIKNKLSSIKGVTTTEIDFEEGMKQMVVKIDENEVKRLGVTTGQVALELRRALSGDSITEIREFNDDVEVKIMFDEKNRKELSSLSMLYIINNQGYRIPLNNIIKLEKNDSAFIIRRLNRKRVISVSAQLNKKEINAVEISRLIKDDARKITSQYPNMTFQFGGENEDTRDSMKGLKKATFISLFLIFFILLVMFGSIGQPIVVMSCIPLGLIGVIFTFFILGIPLGFMAIMGIIALVGVVVNDSIVLVNFINIKRKSEDNLLNAVLNASKERFRPVILTTFTTVAGLLPMAHMPGGDPFIKPMAISFAWGLLFSTAVTLVFIPCNYIVYEQIKIYLKKLLKKIVPQEVS